MKQIKDKEEAQKTLEEILKRYGLVVQSVEENQGRVTVKVLETGPQEKPQRIIN